MEFSMQTLIIFAILVIATLVIIILMQIWSGNSIDIVGSTRDFFNNVVGVTQ